MAKFEDYYEVLQVSPSAESEVIEVAYKKLAKKYHPDVNKSSMAASKMKQINVAYDVLRDPVKRKKYHAKWVREKASYAETGAPTKPKPSSKSKQKQQKVDTTPKPSLATQFSKNKGKVIACAIAGLFVLIAIPVILMNTVFSTQPTAEVGDTVQVHYTGTLADNITFDSSVGRDPLEFTIGEGQLIPGFEEAVKGMKVGEKKTVTIPAEEAYGPRFEDRTEEIPLEKLPEDMTPEVGQRLVAVNPDGSGAIVTIISISDNVVVVDTNHPLAGKDLTFEIELVKIL